MRRVDELCLLATKGHPHRVSKSVNRLSLHRAEDIVKSLLK